MHADKFPDRTTAICAMDHKWDSSKIHHDTLAIILEQFTNSRKQHDRLRGKWWNAFKRGDNSPNVLDIPDFAETVKGQRAMASQTRLIAVSFRSNFMPFSVSQPVHCFAAAPYRRK